MYQHERIKGVNVCIVVIYLYQWLAVISFVSCGFVHCSCCSISDARRSGDRYRRDYNCTVRGVYHSTVTSRAQYWHINPYMLCPCCCLVGRYCVVCRY